MDTVDAFYGDTDNNNNLCDIGFARSYSPKRPHYSPPVPQFSVKSTCSSHVSPWPPAVSHHPRWAPSITRGCVSHCCSHLQPCLTSSSPPSPQSAEALAVSQLPPGSRAGFVAFRVVWACPAGHCVLLLPRVGGCSEQAVVSPGVCPRLVLGGEGAILVSLGEENWLVCCTMVGLIAI